MTHKKPLTLALVIPVYNEEIYLAQCLDSVAAQTVKPTEVIVVDNNSTDKTEEIAKRYPFVKLLKEKQQGVTFARNKGFNAVKADIIGRIDADTVLEKDWVKLTQAYFTRHHNVAAVTGLTGIYDVPLPHMTVIFVWFLNVLIFYPAPHGRHYLHGANMAVRKKSWDEVRTQLCTNFGIHEDTDLAIHLEEYGHKLAFNRHMRASASTRRANVDVRHAYRYCFMQKRTYKQHGIRLDGLALGLILFIFYPYLRVQLNTFNPKTRRYSWRYFREQGMQPPLPPIG